MQQNVIVAKVVSAYSSVVWYHKHIGQAFTVLAQPRIWCGEKYYEVTSPFVGETADGYTYYIQADDLVFRDDPDTIQPQQSEAARRKAIPLATGVLDYFPDALRAVAEVSRIGNEQHNPGQPMFWDRSKSQDESDCLARHFLERGTLDTDGMRHSAKVAWRALALLQKEIEGSEQKA